MKVLMAEPNRAHDLVDLAKSGDRVAFDQLVADHRSRLEALINSRLGRGLRGHLEVDDVLQEALLGAFRSIKQFQWERADSFFIWLSTIVENVIRAAAKKHEKTQYLQLDTDVLDSHVPPSKTFRREERFDRLRSSLERLSKEHQEVIILARIEQLRIQEIAAKMNRTPEAVKKLLARALRNLKASFGDTESLHLPKHRLGRESIDEE